MRGERVQERITSSQRRFSLGISWLDLKLGVRMLFKFPGLTLVGTLALTIAITTVSGFHAFTEHFVSPELPVPEGDRVVAIWNVDARDGGYARQTFGDMLAWRRELESLEDVGTFTRHQRVIVNAEGRARSVRAAQISPSAFRMLRVPTFLGRPLVDDDERQGGPAVAVIAYDLWQSEFGADLEIVGKTIRMGGVPHTLVGVMPSGFEFPYSEQLWTPFRIPSNSLAPGEGPGVQFIIGRLASGVTLEEAEAELQGVGARFAAEYSETHEQLRPQIGGYAKSVGPAESRDLVNLMRVLRIVIVVVLIIAGVNVGTLVYARTAARVAEISVRKALGASRRRIALQMFAEALVLASLSGALGIGITMWALKEVLALMSSSDSIPYWWDAGVGSGTVLLVVGLVLLSAVLTGVVPALAITGRRLRSSLQWVGAGESGLRFGKVASAIVVTQVAISLGALTIGGIVVGPFMEDYAMDDGVARAEYLSAELRQDREPSWSDGTEGGAAEFARDAEVWRELGRRVSREPGVLGVTFGTSLPGAEHPVRSYQLAGVPLPFGGAYSNRARVAWIEPGYYATFDVPMLLGRAFNTGDLVGSEARVAIVNEAFVRRVLELGEPIGHRIRLDRSDNGEPGSWAEIVGVVSNVTVDMGSDPGGWPAVYFPLVATANTIHMAVHLGEDPSLFAGRLRSIGGGLDPSLVLDRLGTLDDIVGAPVKVMYLLGLSIGLLVLAALVLATAGVYSLMSFTVSQRTREIGIRTALGAHPRRIVTDVFSRAILQLLLGTALGLLPLMAPGDLLFQYGPWAAIGIAGVMLIMGLAACWNPMRRALRIQPTEALREGG